MIEPLLPGEQPPKRIKRSLSTRPCHSCGREVPSDAWKCRYCSEMLDRPGRAGGMRKKRISTCLLVILVGISVALFFGVIAAIAVPAVLVAKKATNEASAINRCLKVHIAQELYRELNGTYSDIEGLEESGLLEKNLLWIRRQVDEDTAVFRSKHGYRFSMLHVSGSESWAMTAVPVQPGTSGDRSFYVDNTGVVRNEMCTSPDDGFADQDSPQVNRY